MIRKNFLLALLTFKEGIRDRSLYLILFFCILTITFSFILVGFYIRQLDKVSVDILLSTINFAGLLLTFFLSVKLMAKDLDKHGIYFILSKPFSRTQYILGKYCGIMLIIFVCFLILCFCSAITLFFTKIQYNEWFKDFLWIEFFKACYSLFLMFFILNAFVIFFSSITSNSFLVQLLSILIYIAGQIIEEAVLFLKSKIPINAKTETISIVDILRYLLPDLSVFDLKTTAAHSIGISYQYLFYITGYSILYSMVLLLLSAMFFLKKELL